MSRMLKTKANLLLKNLFSIFIVLFIINIVIFPKNSISYVHEALNICYLIIIPSLFPFMIFSKIFMNTPLFAYLNRVLGKPAKALFNISGMYAGAFLIGLFSGFPAGAENTVAVYEKNPHTKEEAERTLGFCNCASAAFIISAVGLAVFKNVHVGFILYIIHVICSIITGIIIKLIYKNKSVPEEEKSTIAKKTPITQNHTQISISKNIADAITSSVISIMQICGIVICFSVMSNILVDIVKIIDMHSLIRNNEMNIISFLLNGILELSSGMEAISTVEISTFAKFVFSAMLLSFGGISVHIQIYNAVQGTNLSLKPYFTGKIINGIITLILSSVFYGFNKGSIKTNYISQPVMFIPNANYDTYSGYLVYAMIISLIVLSFALFIMFTAYLIDRKIRKKVNKI